MWKRQGKAGVHFDRLQNHFLTLNNTPLVEQFLSRYSSYKIPVTKLSLLCHDDGTDLNESAHHDQEQELEQDSSTPPATPKKDQVVELKSQLPDYATKYPNLDIAKEYEKWTDWMAAKGKTFKNYQAAFRNWLRHAEEFKKEKAVEDAPIKLLEPNHPLWPEIKSLPTMEWQQLRHDAMPYARKESQCGDKRDPPEEVTRAYMVKIYEAEKGKMPAPP
jgi:hypothetical protein